MPRQQQDHTIGRERDSNEEIDDAPESAQVKRIAQESFEPEAFGHSLGAFEAQLRRMSGAEDGITDALRTFTEPETGAYFWCPPVHNGQLDLRAVGV